MQTNLRTARTGLAATALIASLALAGCGSSDAGGASGDGGGKLVLYSGDATADEYIERFTAAHPDIEIELISGNTGELLSRVKAEQSKPLGDVYWASGDPAIAEPDLFTKLPEATLDRILPEYQLESGYGVPLNAMLNTIYYNTDLVTKKQAPTSWADLADPKWKGKIYIANPTSSGSGYSVVADWVTVGGWDLVEKIAPNLVVVEGTFAPFQAVSGGEVEIAVSNESFLAFAEDGSPISLVNPSDGASTLTQTIFQIADGPNAENAKTFVDWMVSEQNQTEMVETRPGSRPVVKGDITPNGVAPLADVRLIQQDPGARSEREAWIEKWKEIITSV